ncbi:MAG TPA: FAD-dependent oxidoreductase, partial [Kiloniellaceae bacterium]|nr:FAD-dependent oxidoreductase [Kiloniellaceae bacterium]
PELVDILRQRFLAEGLALFEQSKVVAVAGSGDSLKVTLERAGVREEIEGSHLLVAAGRRPNLKGLGLEAAGVAYDGGGVTVDRRLRTSNKKIFAAGDVCGGYQFTHMAGHHAGIVIRNALFRLPAKVEDKAVPWVTYTAPELAHVGLDETVARARHGTIRVLRWPFSENDRAQAERDTDGLVKVITDARGKVLGASILGTAAGESIHAWILAVAKGLKIGDMAGYIAPYPTRGEAGKRAAGSYYTEKLFGEGTKRLVRFLARFG